MDYSGQSSRGPSQSPWPKPSQQQQPLTAEEQLLQAGETLDPGVYLTGQQDQAPRDSMEQELAQLREDIQAFGHLGAQALLTNQGQQAQELAPPGPLQVAEGQTKTLPGYRNVPPKHH